MPAISRLFGIIIRMFGLEHPPTHFHARYGEFEVQIATETLEVEAGSLPNRKLKLAQDWAAFHQEEFRKNWALLQARRKPLRIEPLR